MSKDALLQHAVEDELEWQPNVNATHIGVAVRDGVVTLTGHVPTYWEKDAAERAAAAVKGVRAVVEELKVELLGNPVADERIAEDALNQIARDSCIPADAIQVHVDNGHVTLTGEVEWKFQKHAAHTDVHKLAGVKWVTNKIAIRPLADAFAVREKIEKALQRVAPFDLDTIMVEADGGKITLSGEVDTLHERDLAETAAWSVPGVTDVQDEIVVA